MDYRDTEILRKHGAKALAALPERRVKDSRHGRASSEVVSAPTS